MLIHLKLLKDIGDFHIEGKDGIKDGIARNNGIGLKCTFGTEEKHTTIENLVSR